MQSGSISVDEQQDETVSNILSKGSKRVIKAVRGRYPRRPRDTGSLEFTVDEADGDGNGRLSLRNCEKLLEKCGYKIPRNVIQTFVKTAGDGSWTLTLDEFLAAMSEVVPPDSPHSKAAELRRLFRAYDLNKDGYVSFYELKNTMRGSITEEELRDFIKDWDKDGDWKLSFEEFINMYVAPMPSDNDEDVASSAESLPSNI